MVPPGSGRRQEGAVRATPDAERGKRELRDSRRRRSGAQVRPVLGSWFLVLGSWFLVSSFEFRVHSALHALSAEWLRQNGARRRWQSAFSFSDFICWRTANK